MTYYVDFGPSGSSIREPIPLGYLSAPVVYRHVQQYVIFETEPTGMVRHRACSIVKGMMDGGFVKLKWPNSGKSVYGQYLTADEEATLMIQILKSEVWTPRSE